MFNMFYSKKILTTITGVAIATSISSNSVFASHQFKTFSEKSISSISNTYKNSPVRFLNLQQLEDVKIDGEDEKKKKNINSNNKLLKILNMSENQYKNALKSGKTLEQLLNEKNKIEEYKKILLQEYENTLKVAVDNNSISKADMLLLIDKYKKYLQTENIFGNKKNTITTKNNDFILDLLEIDEKTYREKIKNGDTMQSLLAKKNKLLEFEKINNMNFENSIQFAVESGSITEADAENILKKYYSKKNLKQAC